MPAKMQSRLGLPAIHFSPMRWKSPTRSPASRMGCSACTGIAGNALAKFVTRFARGIPGCWTPVHLSPCPLSSHGAQSCGTCCPGRRRSRLPPMRRQGHLCILTPVPLFCGDTLIGAAFILPRMGFPFFILPPPLLPGKRASPSLPFPSRRQPGRQPNKQKKNSSLQLFPCFPEQAVI